MIRGEIVARIAAQSPGAADEPWGAVTSSANRAPDARLPGSLKHDHNPESDPHLIVPIVPAAVLVPILERAEGMTVLLTRRTDHLARHAGQVSFPGGRADPEDETPAATALREANEEIGLALEHVSVAGRLDNYLVGTGYRVTPVVGVVSPSARITHAEDEVAEVFEVPLAFVRDAGNYRHEEMTLKGFTRRFHALSYREHHIWGATAAILVNLRKALGPSC